MFDERLAHQEVCLDQGRRVATFRLELDGLVAELYRAAILTLLDVDDCKIGQIGLFKLAQFGNGLSKLLCCGVLLAEVALRVLRFEEVVDADVDLRGFVKLLRLKEPRGDVFEEEDSFDALFRWQLEDVLFLVDVEQLERDNSRLFHVLEPFKFENPVHFVI